MDKRPAYKRTMPADYKGGGVVSFMAAKDGYAMIRRPGCSPFVVPVRIWNGWDEVK